MTRCLKAIPLGVVDEFTLLRVLLGHILDLEFFDLVLAWSWQFQLLKLQDVVNHGGLGGFQPLSRVSHAVFVFVSTPF